MRYALWKNIILQIYNTLFRSLKISQFHESSSRRTLMDLRRGMCGYNAFDMDTIAITYVTLPRYRSVTLLISHCCNWKLYYGVDCMLYVFTPMKRSVEIEKW